MRAATFEHGNADVTKVRNDLFSHFRISQQFFKLLTEVSLELSADWDLACSAKNMRWIHTLGLRVLIVKKPLLYRQCSPCPWQAKCNLAIFLDFLSGSIMGYGQI